MTHRTVARAPARHRLTAHHALTIAFAAATALADRLAAAEDPAPPQADGGSGGADGVTRRTAGRDLDEDAAGADPARSVATGAPAA